MIRAFRKPIAWMAAALLLFSALSPSMAAALFSERPDVMARVLGVPAPHAVAAAAPDHADGCEHESPAAVTASHHGEGGVPPGDAPAHAAHGTYCSFCLAASAGVTLPGVPAAMVALVMGMADAVPLQFDHAPPQRPPSNQQARAPPSPS